MRRLTLLVFATAIWLLSVPFAPGQTTPESVGSSQQPGRRGANFTTLPRPVSGNVASPGKPEAPPTVVPEKSHKPPAIDRNRERGRRAGSGGEWRDRDWRDVRRRSDYRGDWRGGADWLWGGVTLPGLFVPAVPIFGFNYGLPFDEPLPVAAPAPPIVDPPTPTTDKPTPRASSPEQLARAGRFVGFGDAQFTKQKYLAALGRYKTAVETAPDLAEGYLRQALAQVALGQYSAAARMMKRALHLRGDWRNAGFRLEQLYGDNAISKTQHLENLAKAVEDNPFDGDLLLTLGLMLYFDGQADRAAVFLSRVAQFGGDEGMLVYFLAPPKPAGAADPPARGGKVVF